MEQIFSIFIKNNELFIILPIINTSIDETYLEVTADNQPLTIKTIHKKDEIEPIHIIIYDIIQVTNVTITKIQIKYQDKIIITKDITPEPPPNENAESQMAITTLFKDDYFLFPLYYEYYTKQGIDHFFMYYNGILNEEIRQIFNHPNVTLIEWDFPYWNNTNDQKYIHNAQMGQIHEALHKYVKNNYKYLIFCDFDEYLYIPNTQLKQFVFTYQDIDVFGFNNKWVQTIDGNIPTTFPTNFLAEDDVLYYGIRSKNIYKIQPSLQTVGIHSPKEPNVYFMPNLTMYQFYTWTNNQNRTIKDFPIHVTIKF